ncbi:IS30 family transposase [Agrococcus sp. KRD186]|uniref:IS30 family transposase n=1 Tax=Agrococcus sp. KRD186 TaxID=2729730 RepID=UPI0019CFF831|nr:IS30 family transposase [Agrococcus sp. KRD186]
MVDKQRAFAKLLQQGVSISEACRRLGIDRKTGHWWKNGGVIVTETGSRVVEPVVGRYQRAPDSGRYLSEAERVLIADGTRLGKSARAIAAELGRAVSTVARELTRNRASDGAYHPYTAQALMRARRPRPKRRRLETDDRLRLLVLAYLDKRWSPEQIVHDLAAQHGERIAVETIYQALYSPSKVIARDAGAVLRTGRLHRRPRRRGDQRRPRFVVPITPIDQRPATVLNRIEPGHWEGDCIVGAFNRSAIGTLVERTFRYTILLHLDGDSRAGAIRDQLIATFSALPPSMRKSLTWDQGSEMSHHHTVAQAVGMPVFFCDPGKPWQRPTNENTNGLLRDYFPKGTNLRVHSVEGLQRVSNELNRRPRKTLGWHTPHDLFANLQATAV